MVANLSAVIALARVCHLGLLEKPFKEIAVPEALWKEATLEGKACRRKILREVS